MNRKLSRATRAGYFWSEIGGSKKKSFRYNVIQHMWLNYKASENFEWLAQICEDEPFFDHPDIGKEIAGILRSSNKRKTGIDKEIELDITLTLYENLSKDPKWASASQEARMLYVAEQIGIDLNKRTKWVDGFKKRVSANKKNDLQDKT